MIRRNEGLDAARYDAFGDAITDQRTPTAQVDFVYGIQSVQCETFASGTGAGNSASGGLVSVTSGTDALGMATTQSLRQVRYRPGQGAQARLTALFSAPLAYQTQLAGFGNATSGYYFGYYDVAGSVPEFGAAHVYGGAVEIQTLTVSTGSSTAENITITLNGTAVTDVTVTNSGSTTTTASEIAAYDYGSTGSGWDAQAIGSTVVFVCRRAGDESAGAFTLSGATSAVGTFAQTKNGAANTFDFVPQSSWNGASLAGAFDPTKGNIYRIDISYLGFGPARFFIANPSDGAPLLVHTIYNVNARTTPVLSNPGLSLRWVAANLGATSAATLQGASGATFVTGLRLDQSVNSVATGEVSYTAGGGAGTETAILSIEPRREFGGVAMRGHLRILEIAAAWEGTKVATLRVYRNATLTATDYQYEDQTASMAIYDTSATAFTGGRLIATEPLAKSDSRKIDFSALDLLFGLGESLTVTIQSSANGEVDASALWAEEP